MAQKIERIFLSVHAFEQGAVLKNSLLFFNCPPEHFEKLPQYQKDEIYKAVGEGRALVQTTQYPLKTTDLNYLLEKNGLSSIPDSPYSPKNAAKALLEKNLTVFL